MNEKEKQIETETIDNNKINRIITTINRQKLNDNDPIDEENAYRIITEINHCTREQIEGLNQASKMLEEAVWEHYELHNKPGDRDAWGTVCTPPGILGRACSRYGRAREKIIELAKSELE